MTRLSLACVLVFCLGISQLMGQTPAPATPPAVMMPEPLAPGKTISAEIAAGTRHVYQLPAAAGHFLELTLIKPGLKGSLRLLNPAGKRLQAEDDLTGAGKETTISAITREPAAYQIEIYAYRNQPSQRYELTLTAWRHPIGHDALIGELREKFFEALMASREDRPADARAAYDRALQIQQIVYGPLDQRNAFVLTQRAIGEMELGELGQAAQSNEQALRIYEQLPFDHRITKALLGLSQALSTRGENARALPYIERAVAIEEQTNGSLSPQLAFYLLTQARVLFALEEYDKAAVAAERGLALAEKNFGVDAPHTAVYLELFGRIAQAQRNYEKAERLYRQALKANQNGMGENPGVTRELLFNQANLAHDRGQYEEAIQLYAQVAQLIEKNPQNQYELGLWFRWAATEFANGQPRRALAPLGQELAQDTVAMRLNLNYGTEAQKIAFHETLTATADFALWLHLARLPDDEQAQKLATTAILQFKGRIQEALADQLTTLRSRLGTEQQQWLTQLQAVISRLARQSFEASQGNVEAEKTLPALMAERDRLETELTKSSDGYYTPTRSVRLDEVRLAIPPKAALLEFAAYRPYDARSPFDHPRFDAPRYAVCVLQRDQESRCYDLGDAQIINDAVGAWRNALRDPNRNDQTRLGRAVAGLIIAPLRHHLAGLEHLLIAPDGALNLIPFEALPDIADGYLVERFAVSYLTTGRDLLRLQTTRPTSSAPLVVADPDFGDRASTTITTNSKRQRTGASRRSVTSGKDLSQVYFAPLLGSALEARKIKQLFPETIALTGTQASETALHRIAAPRLLHLATHGFFLNPPQTEAIPKNATASLHPMLRSGLALAGANARMQREGTDDGLLTALEASGLNLWGTQLVTLSACDTGLGEVRTGEGVYGLRRAFTLAGTETLMMSLWPVSDLVTRELMSAYYTRLQQGESRGASLRQTQLEMLKRPNRRHPFYWAGFIQAGEWGTLAGQR